MRSGDLIHRISIESPTETTSASGAVSVTWSTLAQRWAQDMPRGGREYFAASAITAELTHVWQCPGYMAVTPKMRVSFDGRYMDILAAYGVDGKSPAKAAEVILVCREGQSQGS